MSAGCQHVHSGNQKGLPRDAKEGHSSRPLFEHLRDVPLQRERATLRFSSGCAPTDARPPTTPLRQLPNEATRMCRSEREPKGSPSMAIVASRQQRMAIGPSSIGPRPTDTVCHMRVTSRTPCTGIPPSPIGSMLGEITFTQKHGRDRALVPANVIVDPDPKVKPKARRARFSLPQVPASARHRYGGVCARQTQILVSRQDQERFVPDQGAISIVAHGFGCRHEFGSTGLEPASRLPASGALPAVLERCPCFRARARAHAHSVFMARHRHYCARKGARNVAFCLGIIAR